MVVSQARLGRRIGPVVLPVVEGWCTVELGEGREAVARMVLLVGDRWAGRFGCRAVAAAVG